MEKSDKKTKQENREKDRFTVVLEDLRSQFMTFGGGLGLVSDKIDNLEVKVDNLETKVDNLETKVDEMNERLIRVEDDVIEIKHKLSEKVDLADFQKLEKRLVKLEKLVLAAK